LAVHEYEMIQLRGLDRKDKRHPVSLGKRQGLSTFALRGRSFRIRGHLLVTTDRDFAGTGIASWSTANLMRALTAGA